MPRPRRTAALTSGLLVATAVAVAACGGGVDSEPSSTTTTSSSSTSSSTSPSETSPTDEVTPDPYAINCDLITQQVVDKWTGDGKPSSVEATEDGCRVVSSAPQGGLIIQWHYLDVEEDQGLVREVSKNSRAVEIEEGVTAVRSESDVDPTRKTRLYVTFDNSRTLYVEATATLDRPRTMSELEDMTSTVVKTYAHRPPAPNTPSTPETSSTSS